MTSNGFDDPQTETVPRIGVLLQGRRRVDRPARFYFSAAASGATGL